MTVVAHHPVVIHTECVLSGRITSYNVCYTKLLRALGGMVANLSAHKRGWDDRWEDFSDWAEQAKAFQVKLLGLVDEDTNAFNQIMNAYGLPKSTVEEKIVRDEAIQTATIHRITSYNVCYTKLLRNSSEEESIQVILQICVEIFIVYKFKVFQ